MGYFVHYELRLSYARCNEARGVALANALHDDAELEAHANGECAGWGITDATPVRQRKWYSWVDNPTEPYTTLREAITNWGLVEEDAEWSTETAEDRTIVRGRYNNKLGQQDVLLRRLAPFLDDAVMK